MQMSILALMHPQYWATVLVAAATLYNCEGVMAQTRNSDSKRVRTPGKRVAPEVAMVPGMRIEATNRVGTIIITAIDDFTRSYTWEGSTRSEELGARLKRWNGSLGLVGTGAGNHWDEHNGITRGVLEEGQQHFASVERALQWVRSRNETLDYVYRGDGLVVGWGKNLSRNQLNVEVWQLMINGMKPTGLSGSCNDKVKVTTVDPESSALVKSVKKNDARVVQELLKKGSDPNTRDCIGAPVLIVAAHRGYDAIVRLLIAHKADVNVKDSDGRTALFCSSLSVMKVLIDAGADVDARVEKGDLYRGQTALMAAVADDDFERVKLLLRSHANVNAKLEDGRTVLMLAEGSDMVRVLKSAGAKE
jgi:hypothetical protein